MYLAEEQRCPFCFVSFIQWLPAKAKGRSTLRLDSLVPRLACVFARLRLPSRFTPRPAHSGGSSPVVRSQKEHLLTSDLTEPLDMSARGASGTWFCSSFFLQALRWIVVGRQALRGCSGCKSVAGRHGLARAYICLSDRFTNRQESVCKGSIRSWVSFCKVSSVSSLGVAWGLLGVTLQTIATSLSSIPRHSADGFSMVFAARCTLRGMLHCYIRTAQHCLRNNYGEAPTPVGRMLRNHVPSL